MDYQEAIKILHPDTRWAKLGEIDYFGGLNGPKQKMEADRSARVLACEAMQELQLYKDEKLCLAPADMYVKQRAELDEYKQLGTLEEVRAAVNEYRRDINDLK